MVIRVGPDTQSAVYLLRHRDEPRFKLGWSVDPQHRIVMLPEFREGCLDLDASRVVWLPYRERAQDVESSMHKILRPFAVRPGHQGDGFSEWFDTRAWDRALELLAQIPLHGNATRLARVHTLSGVLQDAPTATDGAIPARDAWLRIEDVLRRLARHLRMRLDVASSASSGPLLRVLDLRQQWSGALAELRNVVLDADTWQFRSHGRAQTFVQWISYDGDDLLLQFRPLRGLEGWDPEMDLPTQAQALLCRLALQGQVPDPGQPRLDA